MQHQAGTSFVDWATPLTDHLELRCCRASQGAVGQIALAGELDGSATRRLSAMVATLSHSRPRLNLDLSDVTFIDAGGLRALRNAASTARSHGSRLTVHPSAVVSRLAALIDEVEGQGDSPGTFDRLLTFATAPSEAAPHSRTAGRTPPIDLATAKARGRTEPRTARYVGCRTGSGGA